MKQQDICQTVVNECLGTTTEIVIGILLSVFILYAVFVQSLKINKTDLFQGVLFHVSPESEQPWSQTDLA